MTAPRAGGRQCNAFWHQLAGQSCGRACCALAHRPGRQWCGYNVQPFGKLACKMSHRFTAVATARHTGQPTHSRNTNRHEHSHLRRLQSFRACAGPAQAEQPGATSSPRAAVLVIGDEVLSGAIQDTNAPWLAKLLHSRGCNMMRFECVPDCIPSIADALHRMREIVGPDGVVFTSGASVGLGCPQTTACAVQRQHLFQVMCMTRWSAGRSGPSP